MDAVTTQLLSSLFHLPESIAIEAVYPTTTHLTIYLRWKEQDLLSLSPLVRLLWGSLIDELITTYDDTQGNGCKPVLLLIDEAGRTAIPMLADQATTVVGRGISLRVNLSGSVSLPYR